MTIFGNTLNYADLAVIAIFLIAAVTGFCRGLVISIVNFIRASVGMFLCFYISSNGAQPIYEKYIRQQCLDTINEKIVTTGNIDEVIENLNSFSTSVPKFISDTMNLKSVDISSADIAQSILTGVFEPVALFLTKAVLFIAVFIIFFLSTAIIIRVVRKVNKRKNENRGRESLLKKTDRLLGLVFGLLKASVLVLAITSVLMYILSWKPELASTNAFFQQVDGSQLLHSLNNINPFNAVTEGLI